MTDQRPPKKTETLEVRMPHEMKRAFIEACRAHGSTASDVVREFAEGYLKRCERRARLRDVINPERSLAMLFSSPRRRLAAISAGFAGAVGLVMAGLAPSVADWSFQTTFEELDRDGDGLVSVEEFSNPSGSHYVFISGEGEPPSWAPVIPPTPEPPALETTALDAGRVTGAAPVVPAAPVAPAAPPPPAVVVEMLGHEFRRFDADSDGYIGYVEFSGRNETIAGDAFRRLDANEDGRLTLEEFHAMPAARASGPPRLIAPRDIEAFELLDEDGDGVVTSDEFAEGLRGQ